MRKRLRKGWKSCLVVVSFAAVLGVLDVAPFRGAVPVRESVAQAQDAQGKPKASFENTEFDFGTVSQGTKVAHDFRLMNVGEADLLVQRVVAACGCTAASAVNTPVTPGTDTMVHVEFDTKGFSGEKLKTVRVYTNDVDNPSQVLTLKGVVEPDVSVEPRSIFFEQIVRGTPTEENVQEVKIEVRRGANVTIDSVKSFAKYVVLQEIEATPTKRRFSVGISPEAPVGDMRERVIVGLKGATEAGAETSVNIPIFAAVKGQVNLKPSQLSFGVIEGTAPLVRSFRIENRGPEQINVKDVHSNNDAVRAAMKVLEAGRKYEVEVTVDPVKVKRDLRAAIDVVTDSEIEGTLSLNVYGIVPPKA